MAAYDTLRAPYTSVFAGRFGAFIVNTIGTVADWNDKRLTRKQLNALSERELGDIGLCRGDIDIVVNKGSRFR